MTLDFAELRLATLGTIPPRMCFLNLLFGPL
jgi:hypothetical protein